ncbi:MAG: putative toxin-antitoxin system toxin component, PIN family [Candidatus Freyarchaeum deiterrae]
MLKVVFDTNVLVSGTVHAGKSKLLIDAVLEGKIILILSAQIILEFKKVITRDKFKLSRNQQNVIMNFVLSVSNIVSVKSRFKVVRQDPSDDIILRTSYDGKADYIVSGDQHLLSLKEFKGIKIVTINEMLELLKP